MATTLRSAAGDAKTRVASTAAAASASAPAVRVPGRVTSMSRDGGADAERRTVQRERRERGDQPVVRSRCRQSVADQLELRLQLASAGRRPPWAARSPRGEQHRRLGVVGPCAARAAGDRARFWWAAAVTRSDLPRLPIGSSTRPAVDGSALAGRRRRCVRPASAVPAAAATAAGTPTSHAGSALRRASASRRQPSPASATTIDAPTRQQAYTAAVRSSPGGTSRPPGGRAAPRPRERPPASAVDPRGQLAERRQPRRRSPARARRPPSRDHRRLPMSLARAPIRRAVGAVAPALGPQTRVRDPAPRVAGHLAARPRPAGATLRRNGGRRRAAAAAAGRAGSARRRSGRAAPTAAAPVRRPSRPARATTPSSAGSARVSRPPAGCRRRSRRSRAAARPVAYGARNAARTSAAGERERGPGSGGAADEGRRSHADAVAQQRGSAPAGSGARAWRRPGPTTPVLVSTMPASRSRMRARPSRARSGRPSRARRCTIRPVMPERGDDPVQVVDPSASVRGRSSRSENPIPSWSTATTRQPGWRLGEEAAPQIGPGGIAVDAEHRPDIGGARRCPGRARCAARRPRRRRRHVDDQRGSKPGSEPSSIAWDRSDAAACRSPDEFGVRGVQARADAEQQDPLVGPERRSICRASVNGTAAGPMLP